MKVKDLKNALGNFDDDADIITFNRTSHRWFKTGGIENYQILSVKDLSERCGDYAKKQLEKFNATDATLFF